MEGHGGEEETRNESQTVVAYPDSATGRGLEGKDPGAAAGAAAGTAGGGGVLAQAAPFDEGKEVCLGRRRVHRDPSTTEVLLHEGFPVTIEVTHETTAAAAREQMERDGVLAIPALKAGFKFLTKLGGLLTPHQEDTRMVYKLVDGDVLALHALAGAADGTN